MAGGSTTRWCNDGLLLMVRPRLQPAVVSARSWLARFASFSPKVRRSMEIVGRELALAAQGGDDPDDFYGARYFGVGRDPSGDRKGRSGYANYDRLSSNADIAAHVVWRTFGGARSILDVGCARGFLVEALRELGLDAEGCDASRFAVEHPAPGAKGHIRVGDPTVGLPWPDDAFDVVCALETLEHLPPSEVPKALNEIRRVSQTAVYVTIPSFGPSGGPGPEGHFDGKVRPDRLAHYETLGDDYDGPVPFDDLARDGDGAPVEGHLTIASFGWWTARFSDAGLVRRPDLEASIHRDIDPAGLAPFWNLYVFVEANPSSAVITPRDPDKNLVELGLHHPLYAS